MGDVLTMPQLRVRSEFTFRSTFAPVAALAARLVEIGAPAAAMVDGGTWGHSRWAKAGQKHGFKPLFGVELAVAQPSGKKPTAWALAEDTKAFYRFSTAAARADANVEELFRTSPGIIRFAGAALTDPETFDYIDLNPASPLQQRAALALHAKTKRPLVVTSDNWYASKSDYSAFMALSGRDRATPQHILTMDELRSEMRMLDDKQFSSAIRNSIDIAKRCAGELPSAPLIHFDGDLTALTRAGQATRLALGHIAEWNDVYEARLVRELAMIATKKYESYFLVVADLIAWAKTRMLVGPGRGSSAGSLVCYLLRITEIDPLEHDLLFERFIDVTRNDLPDIDIDFADSKRDLIFGYLAEKYGAENVARIGNINTLGAKSVINKVCDRFAINPREKFDVINVMIDYTSGDSRYGHSLEDTMAQTEPGKRFSAAHPEAAIMYRLENHASHTGVHAAGVIVCNEPISHYCTVGESGVAQIDKPYSEQVGLLKIDALGLRTLGVIEDAGVVTADELYALKLNDPEVLRVFNEQRYAGVFQFEGQAQRRVAAEVHIDSFRKIDHVTALARPGPLGGGASQHYIARAAGREEVTYRHPSMSAYLGATMGVVLYQEQVMRISFEIGRFSWEVVSEIRKAMSGRKGKEYFDRRGAEFVAGAATIGLAEREAREIWAEICTFGAWGMNASHTVSYGVISYWCAWMKRYHLIEYIAACLRNAKDEAQAYDMLREVAKEGVTFVAFDIDRSDVDWKAVDGVLVGGFMNLVGFGPAKAVAAVEQRAAGKMTEKLRERIAASEVRFAELYPLQAAYSAIYDDPESFGCSAGSRVSKLNALPEDGTVLTICQVVEKKLRDENEAVLVARRNGKRREGRTLFLDIIVGDDTGVPCTIRVDRFKFEPLGRIAAERLRPGDHLLIRGQRIPNFSMIKAIRIKCLNRPDAFDDRPPEPTTGETQELASHA
jgi:DNA polymerase III alpha subunit